MKTNEITRRFIRILYGNEIDSIDGYLNIVGIKNKIPDTRSHPVQETDRIIDDISRLSETKDVYFEVCLQREKAERGKRGREKGAFVMPGCWFDLDIAGPSHKETDLPSEEEAQSFVESFELSPSLIVHSGGGWHIYWLFDKPWHLKTEKDNASAQKISRGFQNCIIGLGKKHGWKMDSTFDLCRLLRVPGTFNYKNGGKTQVQIIQERPDIRYEPTDFIGYVNQEPKHVPAPPKKTKPKKVRETVSDASADATKIVEGCGWMRHCRDDAENLTEPEWFGMLSILSRCVNGEKVAHVWSKPYPGYSYEETQDKLDHSLDGGPRTCVHICDNLHGEPYCAECQWIGQIKSPILLGVVPQNNNDSATGGQLQFETTDLGNAKRLVSRHGADLKFCKEFGWMFWNGKHWEKDETGEIERRAKETVLSIASESTNNMSDIRKHAHLSQSAARIRNMITLTQSEEGVAVKPDHFDQKDWSICCQNGTMDLRTGELKPHDRSDLISKVCPVSYDPDSQCPQFTAFLDRIMDGNQNLIEFLKRAVGYSLTADISEQCLFFLYGSGCNGKSTFLETIRRMVGDYAGQSEAKTFLQQWSDTIRSDLARLKGVRLVTASEIEENRKLSEVSVKQMTGSDVITARFLFKNEFEFLPKFKVFLSANHKPRISGTDYGIWRRILLIPFTVRIREAERNKHLDQALLEELDGIFRWAVEGCLEWQRDGLNPPDEVVYATDEYRKEQDVVEDFIQDCCLIDPSASVPKGDLYEAYEHWATRCKEKAVGKKSFGKKIIEKGFADDRKGGQRVWKGIGLLVEDTASVYHN